MAKTVVVLWTVALLVARPGFSSHFRGGMITWEPGDPDPQQVTFQSTSNWNWARKSCRDTDILTGVLFDGDGDWTCTNSDCTGTAVADTKFYCVAASEEETWTQGERTFTYTFGGPGPYLIEWTDGNWIDFNTGKGGKWTLEASIHLAVRSDTGRPNHSPTSTLPPMVWAQLGCENKIMIPKLDRDGDLLWCRWAVGHECNSICGPLPGSTLEQPSRLDFIILNGSSGQLPGQQLAQGSCPAGTSGQLPGRYLRAVARPVPQGSCPAGTSGQLPGRYLRAVARLVPQGSCPAETSGQLPGW
ncbi:Hypp2131 [Branchiostoma lanceolatum]|uniref:Hypp2131 protein n=1 Tax=Branchiostoma lanceolatum TaxID=7740 RepID=A0A8J9ZRW8_BRALA|nr:Hypp2131 [Branchiostoma lanceolatum]